MTRPQAAGRSILVGDILVPAAAHLVITGALGAIGAGPGALPASPAGSGPMALIGRGG